MLTVEALRAFGADTEDGLNRCMGNEGFYLKLVGRVLEDKNFEVLAESIARQDLDSAFDAAHSLKASSEIWRLLRSFNLFVTSRSSCGRKPTWTMHLCFARSRRCGMSWCACSECEVTAKYQEIVFQHF